MSRPRLLVGSIVFTLVCLVAAAVAIAATGRQGAKNPAPRAEYTVASASASASSASAEAEVALGPRLALPSRGKLGPLSETLTLLVVGTMLIGLAAAVRRTN